jgi:hypothetical protein
VTSSHFSTFLETGSKVESGQVGYFWPVSDMSLQGIFLTVFGLKSQYAMFKIEVFNALQMRFGPSKYASLKTTLQNAIPY